MPHGFRVFVSRGRSRSLIAYVSYNASGSYFGRGGFLRLHLVQQSSFRDGALLCRDTKLVVRLAYVVYGDRFSVFLRKFCFTSQVSPYLFLCCITCLYGGEWGFFTFFCYVFVGGNMCCRLLDKVAQGRLIPR